MTEEEAVERPERPPWEGSASAPLHVNVVQVFGGPFDVTLQFGEQDLSSRLPDGQAARTREVVQLSMSWAHLKSMVPLLARVVANYEQQIGEIVAPGFDQMWKE